MLVNLHAHSRRIVHGQLTTKYRLGLRSLSRSLPPPYTALVLPLQPCQTRRAILKSPDDIPHQSNSLPLLVSLPQILDMPEWDFVGIIVQENLALEVVTDSTKP